MKKNKGKFIVIDGPDGVGKTGMINMLSNILTKKNHTVFLRDQYIENDVCAKIKKIFIEDGDKIDNSTAACLSLASRIILNKEISKALNKGNNVICDRYLSSTIALNTDNNDDIYNVLMASKIIKNAYIKPDMYIILKFDKDAKIPEPKDKFEERLHSKDQCEKFDMLEHILDNVYYVYINPDSKMSRILAMINIFKLLAIYDDYKNIIPTISDYIDKQSKKK